MANRLRFPVARSILVVAVILFGGGTILAQSSRLDPNVLAQIQALTEEKKARTPAQQKVD